MLVVISSYFLYFFLWRVTFTEEEGDGILVTNRVADDESLSALSSPLTLLSLSQYQTHKVTQTWIQHIQDHSSLPHHLFLDTKSSYVLEGEVLVETCTQVKVLYKVVILENI